MPILRRDDGSQFIIHPYREILKVERNRTLKRKIRMLAREYGNNLRIFQTTDPNKIEVVLSRDFGFLLGETVRNYFNKPSNLIYCEALFERNVALMVIVKDGLILLDSRLTYSEVIEELASLGSAMQKYDIYVYGDVPLGTNKEGDKYFVLEDQVVKSFNTLNESVLMHLSMDREVQLQPLELALTSPYLGTSKFGSIIAGIFFIIIFFIGWQVYKSFLAEPIKRQVEAVKRAENPFLNFYLSLSKPYPKEQLIEFASMEKLVMSLPPGWGCKEINFDGNTYNIEIVSEGGSMTMLRDWMKKRNFAFSFNMTSMPITVPSKLKARPSSKVIYHLDDVLTILIDEINTVLTGMGNVKFEGMDNKGSYKEARITIHVDNVFVGVLFLIGNELNKMPASIDSIKMVVADNSLYTGDIKIKVFGD
jgi:hypothetical protein